MTDSPTNPGDAHPRPEKEYEDPHFHDEELEVQDDDPPRPGRMPGKRKPSRRPPPRRRYPDD